MNDLNLGSVFASLMVQVMAMSRHEVRQLFIKIPTGEILSLSRVEDADWAGLTAYAADTTGVALVDLTTEDLYTS